MLIDLLHRYVRARHHAAGFRSDFLDTDVGRLHFLIREPATGLGTLVLVHGLGTSSSSWFKALRHINARYRIAALDLPGFGFSSAKNPKEFCTLQECVTALTAFVTHLDRGPITLLGHSLGGWVSARFAAQHPEQVRYLILVDTAGVYYRGIERLRETFTVSSIRDTRRLLNKLWYRYPWYFKPFSGAVYRDLRRRHVDEFVQSIEAEEILVEELASLRMPVSIIWGKEDAIMSIECVSSLRKLMPHADVSFIESCGHVPQLERPVQFATILNGALERKT